MNKALLILQERGFLQQCTNLDGLSKAMDEGPVTFYVGADPTGPSLHIGHMVPFFAFSHLRKAGHKGIALLGGGTARIGDPSGKSSMRQMITYEQIAENAASMTRQLDRFMGFDGQSSITANNADWLAQLNYIDFLRDIGVHFSVNRMLSFEAYKQRMETGLTFIEFNYQLLQSYDFLQLFDRHGCTLQIGGDDQWGNIVAGIDLVRRMRGKEVFGLTFPLITTSDGKKMGKTEKGALFLDASMVSPYDFFQYWRNVTDDDVTRFFKMFTFLPMEQINEMAGWKDQKINEAKEILAYEVTKSIHGEEEAKKALSGAKAAFTGGMDRSSMPTCEIPSSEWKPGIAVMDLYVRSGLCASKSEARRLIKEGGASVDEEKIVDENTVIGEAFLTDGELVLRAGKKRFVRVIEKK
jgi:tyrosyl-tRNA synthetase